MLSYAEMEEAMGIVPLEHKAEKGVPTGNACSWSNFENDNGYFNSLISIATSPELREFWKDEMDDAITKERSLALAKKLLAKLE